jgi:hypothetical protein
MLPNLNHLLTFKSQKILDRYQQDYPENKLSSEKALREILKYFWLCEKHWLERKQEPDNESLHFTCAVHPEMHEIDDMWHTFLLFTQEYAHFCQTYFDRFIHHNPVTEKEIISREEYEIDLQRYLPYIYDNLGEETLKLWFQYET